MSYTSSLINSPDKGINDRATAVTRARYDRIAALYDLMPMQVMVGRKSRPWREKMWQMAGNSSVGINITY
jgi:hypothetical protein